MTNKIWIPILSSVLIFPTLGNFAQAESHSSIVNEMGEEQTATGDASESIKIVEETFETVDQEISEGNADSESDFATIVPTNSIETKDSLSNEHSKKIETRTVVNPIESNDDPEEQNIVFNVNKLDEINYGEVYSNNKLIQILEFYPNTKKDDSEKKILYSFEINSNGHVTAAEKLDEKTQAITSHYQYYPETTYGEHGNRIKYIFDLDSNNYIVNASMRELGTKRILSRYQYYPKTTYGDHGNNILNIFDLDPSGFITSASKREQGTKRILSRYQYYPKTTFGDHGNNIMNIFDIDSSGYITSASKRKQGSKRILSRYQYYPKTTFGNHGNNIMNIFDIDSSGFIKGASKREKGSKRITARYTYYKKTTFGNHGNNILNIFNIDANGYVTKASKREKGSKRILSRYEYYPKTVYGKHGSNIKYQYTLNSNDTISSAILKEQHTKKIKSQYTFKSGTRYGNHWSNVIGVDLNVPIISQLPELPTGCEITAVTMMLQYAGANVNKVALAKAMPRHSWNPNAGYVGDPFTRNGWTIYPSALVSLVRKHVGSATDLTGKSIAGLETQLKNNKPVVVLVSPMHGFTVHAVTLTGFDQSNIYFNDPWTGKKNVKISKNEFNKIWNNQNKRALTY